MNVDPQLKGEITKRLLLDNPWWISNEIPEDYKKMIHRPYTDLFYPQVKDISVRRAVILMGPRRVGKTVMMYHVIDKLLSEGINPRKIIYLSVDTPIYNNMSLEQLFDLAREVLKQDSDHEDFYVFYDEIQYLKNWEVHLKSLVDTYRGSKFIASGSAAAALKRKSTESGAGRFTDFMLPPLTFYEYINLLGHENLIVRTKEGALIPYDSIDIVELNRLFVDYINFGGYPEVIFSETIRANPGQYIRHDIIDKVLLRDLPSLYGITDIQELNKLFVYIAYRSGTEFSYEKMSQESSIRKDVLKKYIEYFEAAFLIKVINRVDRNAKRLQRASSFKIYLTNPSLRSALFSPIDYSDAAIGSMVETAIFAQWPHKASNIFYSNWNIGREKGEVDMVFIDGQTQKPNSVTEIKWSDRYFDSPQEMKSLLQFSKENDYKVSFVTTKTKSGYNSTFRILFVPNAIYAYWISSLIYDGMKFIISSFFNEE